VLRRLRSGQPIFEAHRLHLFQRLQRAGWPHAKVSLLFGGATGLLALGRDIGGTPALASLIGAEVLMALWMEQHHATAFDDEVGRS
jgi:hypothetical protein